MFNINFEQIKSNLENELAAAYDDCESERKAFVESFDAVEKLKSSISNLNRQKEAASKAARDADSRVYDSSLDGDDIESSDLNILSESDKKIGTLKKLISSLAERLDEAENVLKINDLRYQSTLQEKVVPIKVRYQKDVVDEAFLALSPLLSLFGEVLSGFRLNSVLPFSFYPKTRMTWRPTPPILAEDGSIRRILGSGWK